MKTLNKLFIVSLVIALTLLLRSGLPAQTLDFAPIDPNFSLAMQFHKTDTVLVVYPTAYHLTKDDSVLVEGYVFWEQWQAKPAYAYRREDALTMADRSKNIQLFGSYAQFRDPSLLASHIGQLENGFSFQQMNFDQQDAAFFYINEDATRFYTCRNSAEASFPYQVFPAGGYPLNIWLADEFQVQACRDQTNGKWLVNDLDAMRQDYFSPATTNTTFRLHMAKSIYSNAEAEKLSQELSRFSDSLCALLGTDPAAIPVTDCYFYASHHDLGNFIAAPPQQTVYGKSVGNINHITGLDRQVLFHEMGHTIIDHTLGKNDNAFWQEGFRQFTNYHFKQEAYLHDLKETQEKIALLTPELIENLNFQYFSNWAHYPISGIFTAFVIRTMGFDQFLKAYPDQNIEAALLPYFTNKEEAIKAFTEWIQDRPANPCLAPEK